MTGEQPFSHDAEAIMLGNKIAGSSTPAPTPPASQQFRTDQQAARRRVQEARDEQQQAVQKSNEAAVEKQQAQERLNRAKAEELRAGQRVREAQDEQQRLARQRQRIDVVV